MSLPESVLFHPEPETTIHALVSGPPTSAWQTTRTTVIFLHYWGGSSETWSQVNSQISQQHPTVAIDFRGWGKSVGPPHPDAYSMSRLASDVKHVIASLKLQQYIIVGLSMGAKVAQLLAGEGELPGLKGIVLVSPAPPTPLSLPPEMRDQQVHAYDDAALASFVALNVLTASSPSGTALEFLVSDMLRGNEWAKKAWPTYGMGEDITTATSSIRCPVLVVAASKDIVEPLERVENEVCQNIQGARLEVLEGSGHLSPIDCPSDLSEHICQFIHQVHGK
ncbi:unnamed protein product [Clonostachys rosea f. rosea IK726]|uniref:AB hydrolase-1 domain-containing protein n=2 Tax=Bionectria ochroleuca TaxID=29856 RepID=A0A0B7K739_BIOOC|nr:unnamed protein product [Clonostachys rosea f. rosea IK726]